ncbi:redox-regulated ATPase YchF [Mucisphaera sp.]|uniref:redox-regulated ATPase YchF n=1 Tax=Mucisphaera sp. TaxID=2913024 RepID=UPI003D11B084
MEAGIVGLPNVGKSTLFNALTAAGIASENYPFCTIEPNVGVVPVPDPRLARIETHIKTQKVIPAALRLVDIAGIVQGASEGEGLGNKFLSHIRNVDAILQVVRCFEDPDITHVDGKIDPIRDIDTIATELLLADLQTVESSKDKAARTARSGDKEAKARLELLARCQEALNNSKPVRTLDLDPDEQKLLRSFGLITAKPILFIANVDDADPTGGGPLVQQVRDWAKDHGAAGNVVPVCAKLESELAELDDEDRQELLEASGLEEPALAVLARAAYQLLGLQSYFTAGEKEIRAWTIPIGASAPQAAGVIHSDFERGFIRAEVYTVDDLDQLKSEKAIREAGKLRVEGKGYTMQDGDVVHFLFNV